VVRLLYIQIHQWFIWRPSCIPWDFGPVIPMFHHRVNHHSADGSCYGSSNNNRSLKYEQKASDEFVVKHHVFENVSSTVLGDILIRIFMIHPSRIVVLTRGSHDVRCQKRIPGKIMGYWAIHFPSKSATFNLWSNVATYEIPELTTGVWRFYIAKIIGKYGEHL